MTAGNGQTAKPEPVSILIGALGGEGGGVLTDWLVEAAMTRDFPVQSTSIPGVAQRTGATTYYIEIYPEPRSALNGRSPVLALYPSPGRVDIAVASEILEAGRAMENGYVSPDRTTLIASTHRIFSIGEKIAMGDGRFDTDRVHKAARQMARRSILFDMSRIARENDSALNAVLLGVIVGSGSLPIPAEVFETSIRAKGVAVDSNLRGFAAGLAASQSIPEPVSAPDKASTEAGKPLQRLPRELAERLERDFPPETHVMLGEGILQLMDYQGLSYARRYLARLDPVREAEQEHRAGRSEWELTREVGRHLALWMSYEDVIRVADLKTQRSRFARLRTDAGAEPHEPVHITEFLDPGIEEICAVMPRLLARPIIAAAERFEWLKRFRRPMKVRTDTVTGFLKLWLMARMRPLRPLTYRYGEEQPMIDRWLEGVVQAAASSHELALEAAACAKLIKGYGDTYTRGRRNFDRIFYGILIPMAKGSHGGTDGATLVRKAREAALADPEGAALEQVLAAEGIGNAGNP